MNKKTWVLAATLAISMTGAHAQLKGAGSSFAANLYGSWSQLIGKTNDMRLDYSPVGSGGGIKAVSQEHSVDFGASDRPLSRAQLEQSGLAQFPTAVGGVVVMTNLPGISSDKVKLDATVLAGIYRGTIKQWNDPAIRALNPDLALPAQAIVPMFRGDSSGTSFVFTTYLSKLDPQFKAAPGITSNLTVANGKAGKTSTEIAKLVRETPGAIGYFDFSYANDLGLPTVQLKNQWGTFVTANRDSLQLAMRNANWERLQIDQDPTFELDITNAACPTCWPIANTTYVLVPIKGNAANSARVLDFFSHAFQQGDDAAVKEGYVPLPTRAKSLVNVAMRRWRVAIDRTAGAKVVRR